ncbi:MAG: ribonuclease III [bacterium]
MNNLDFLEKTIEYSFKNKSILIQSLTHKSYIYENLSLKNFYNSHNEKMEFLGDSILGMVISEYLIKCFPEAEEGYLTQIKNLIVSEQILAKRARKIDLDKYILLGKGEENTGGKNRNSILSNTFEALICAIYFDSNLETVKKIIFSQFDEEIEIIKKDEHVEDFKTLLQQFSLLKFKTMPQYTVINEIGPQHRKVFTVLVKVENKQSIGSGFTKKLAEQNAAEHILNLLGYSESDDDLDNE